MLQDVIAEQRDAEVRTALALLDDVLFKQAIPDAEVQNLILIQSMIEDLLLIRGEAIQDVVALLADGIMPKQVSTEGERFMIQQVLHRQTETTAQ